MTLRPGIGWAVIEPKARSLKWMLSDYQENPHAATQTVGQYFGAIFATKKLAKETAARWRGARVVKVSITEIDEAT